jgi:membrane protease YdiL (CAAX protease family)
VWFGWPFVVSKWKGLGPASDWGWAIKVSDIGVGVGVAFIATFAAGLVATGVGALVDLQDEDLAENTQILNDLEGSPWLYGLLFAVVIGAPFSEELLFRGLLQRSIQKRFGVVVGVIGSLLVFVPIHLADGGVFGAGQIVLWASIATLGAALGITAAVTGRLAAPIIAHVIINGLASARALGFFDRFLDEAQSAALGLPF